VHLSAVGAESTDDVTLAQAFQLRGLLDEHTGGNGART
jgi:hypothetical protein